nr:hypothetical protein [Tanacetum cinerariifolium]
MLKKKLNMEEDDQINISVKLPSFDSSMDITENEEVKSFVDCACRKVDGAFVTSWRMLFVIPSTNMVKLIGFTEDDDPIVEVDRGRMLLPLQVYDHTSQEFHNVGISADGGSFFIGPYKESLILLNV